MWGEFHHHETHLTRLPTFCSVHHKWLDLSCCWSCPAPAKHHASEEKAREGRWKRLPVTYPPKLPNGWSISRLQQQLKSSHLWRTEQAPSFQSRYMCPWNSHWDWPKNLIKFNASCVADLNSALTSNVWQLKTCDDTFNLRNELATLN